MVQEKKRPRGLKSSSASKKTTTVKKAKTDVDEKDIPENAQTVMINREVEEGDEVGEAAALLDDAMDKLEKNPSEVLALLRGTIHESDRILRNWESEEPLPALFYYTYGTALYELGRLTEDEEFAPFLEAAEERLQDGFDHYKKDGEASQSNQEVLNKMDLTLGKIWLAKAAASVDDDAQEIAELSLKALETLDKACGQQTVTVTTLLDIGNIVQNHGDLYSKLEHRNKFTQWAEGIFKRILKDDPNNARALSELGLSQLSRTNYWLERADEIEENGAEDRTERSKEEQHAYEAVLDAKKYFMESLAALEKNGALTPQIHTDLAEAYLNEANLTSNPDEQNTLYKQVKKCIDEAKLLAAGPDYRLPEGLDLFLEEWSDGKE